MVSGKRTALAWSMLLRTLLLVIVLVLGIFTAFPFHEFNHNIFGYQKPPGFFGFTLADWEIASLLASVFWGGIIYGIIGRRVDYIFFVLIFLFTLWDYWYPPSVPPLMYLGLVGVAVLGNVLGYMLKVGRQNWFGR